jgi:trans-aconitate 2-methyltransferase
MNFITFNQASHVWNADLYCSNSSMQFQAAVKLLSTLEISSCKQIIDLGCGDGKITAMIARSLPEASIVGIDASAQMIDFACRTFPKERNINLEFRLQDINEFNYQNGCDLICSFFALQWISNLDAVFRMIHKSLRQAGMFAFIVPLHISSALDQALQEMIALPEWSGYFETFSTGWYFRDPKEIQDLLNDNHFISHHIEVVAQEISFPSRAHLERFILPWLTHLDRVPESLKDVFYNRLIDRYLELEPSLLDGSVSYKYSLIESVSEKSVTSESK